MREEAAGRRRRRAGHRSSGRCNNKMQYEKVMALVEDARKNGARGRRRRAAGAARLFHPPTIVRDAQEGSKLVDEEQFGPALP